MPNERTLVSFLIFALALVWLPVLVSCSSLPPPRDVAALGVAAARGALLHIDRNTSADDAAGKARVQRIAFALDVATKYLEGEASDVEGAVALNDALALADAAVQELEADKVKVPKEIKAALSAARALLGGE